MRMSICLNAEAEEYRMFRVSFPDYFAAHCGLEFDASPADLRQWREEINRFSECKGAEPMMYHVVKCDDCGFTMTVPWNVAADQHAKAHGWFIYPPQARCPKCGMPKHDEAAHDAV